MVMGGRERAGFQLIPDLLMGLDNLRAHKLRSLLTMLGMIFGVAAVVSMLSIGAGARQQVMAFLEQMGVHNLIVEAREAKTWEDLQKVRKTSPGLTFQDSRMIQAGVNDMTLLSARKRLTPSKIAPKPQRETPLLYGVEPTYAQITGMRIIHGRYFDAAENQSAAPVAILGQAAKESLFGSENALGKFVKVNDQWFQVIGLTAPALATQTNIGDVEATDLNNVIYVPLNSVILRIEDTQSGLKDEIDGLYMRLKDNADIVATADVVRGLLNATHRDTPDFSVIVPAELLAEQKRTQRIFDLVMVAIASISLLVGGIGIMNIMLASILERTREIGVRRAMGARQSDILRQFMIEAILISIVGGTIGVIAGFATSRMIALLAGWSTIVTVSSISVAFLVSVSVGLIFGIYPAIKAARLDPIEAMRYE